jgi:hypothetical protein
VDTKRTQWNEVRIVHHNTPFGVETRALWCLVHVLKCKQSSCASLGNTPIRVMHPPPAAPAETWRFRKTKTVKGWHAITCPPWLNAATRRPFRCDIGIPLSGLRKSRLSVGVKVGRLYGEGWPSFVVNTGTSIVKTEAATATTYAILMHGNQARAVLNRLTKRRALLRASCKAANEAINDSPSSANGVLTPVTCTVVALRRGRSLLRSCPLCLDIHRHRTCHKRRAQRAGHRAVC